MSSRPKKKRRGSRSGAVAQKNPTQQNIIYNTGTTISKSFSGKNYLGRIINYDALQQYYRIEYSDGDGEDLTHEEVTPLLRKLHQTPAIGTITTTIIPITTTIITLTISTVLRDGEIWYKPIY